MNKINVSELSYKKIGIILAVLGLLIIILIWSLSSKEDKSSVLKEDDSFKEAIVVKVTDGSTIWVNIDGYKKKVRLIGIDTPQTGYFNNESYNIQGEQAGQFVESKIAAGQTVYLLKGVSEEDDYSRLPRYVWLEKPKNAEDDGEIRSKMLNAVIVLNGYASISEDSPDTRYTEFFNKYQEEAKNNKAGFWQE